MPYTEKKLLKNVTDGDNPLETLFKDLESQDFKEVTTIGAASLVSSFLPPSAAIAIGALGGIATAIAQDMVPEEEKETKEYIDLASKFSKSLAISGAVNGVLSQGRKKRAS